MAEIALEMKCSLERLREENSRLHEETKTNRLQAQERFEAATCVMKHENHSLKQNLDSAQCALEQAKAAAAAALAPMIRNFTKIQKLLFQFVLRHAFCGKRMQCGRAV